MPSGRAQYVIDSRQTISYIGHCRKRKAVVVAIRGTMSMADVVTDAVVHPEGIDDWLPPKLSKVSNFFLDKEVDACDATSCIAMSVCHWVVSKDPVDFQSRTKCL